MIVRTVTGLTLLGILATPFALSYFAPTEEEAPQVAEVYIVKPPAFEGVVASGEVEPNAVYDLNFEVPGTVREVHMREGGRVQAGDVLAILDNERERIDVADAELALEMRERDLNDLLTVDEDEIRIAEADIQAALNSYAFVANQVRPEDIQAAELEVAAAQESLQAAQDARIRGGGSTDPEAVTLLDAEIGAATFDAEIARLRLEDLRNANAPQLGAASAQRRQAEAELARLLAGPTEFEVRDAELAVQAAQNSLNVAQLAFDRTVLVAPVAGVMAGIDIEPGQQVDSDEIVTRLLDLNPTRMVIQVDEIDLPLVQPGADVTVFVDALPGLPFEATIDRIAAQGTEINGVITYDTEVVLSGSDVRIRPGMSAEALFGETDFLDQLVIPERFIAAGNTVIVAGESGTMEEVTVEVGERTDRGVLVTAGLQEDDAIIRFEQESDTQ